jgi:hypothetical protein
VLDVSKPESPREIGSCAIEGFATGVAVLGKYAFVAGPHFGLRIIDISDPKRPKQIGTYVPPDRGKEGVTGVVVAGQYAYVHGITPPRPIDLNEHPGGGLRVVDVSDPAAPNEVHPRKGQLPVVDGGVIALAIQGSFAYVGAGRKLVIVDLSDPKHPAVLGSTRVRPCNLPDVGVSGQHAFVACEADGLRVLDVSNAMAPKEIGSFRPTEPISAVAVSGKLAFASGPGVVYVLDISDPTAPRELSTYKTGHIALVAASGAYACVTKGAPNEHLRVQILDISNPVAPKEIGIYNPPARAGGSPHLAAADNYLFVLDQLQLKADEGPASLRLVDLSPLAWVRRWPYLVAFAVLASMTLAFSIFLFRRPLKRRLLHAAWIAMAVPPLFLLLVPGRAPREIGHWDVPGDPQALALADRFAYLVGAGKLPGDEKSGKTVSRLWVVDFSDPASPRQVGVCDLPEWGLALAVTVFGMHVYVADGQNGLRVVDVTDPAAPKAVNSYYYQNGGFTRAVALEGRHAILAVGRNGLRVVDISSPAAPKPGGL